MNLISGMLILMDLENTVQVLGVFLSAVESGFVCPIDVP